MFVAERRKLRENKLIPKSVSSKVDSERYGIEDLVKFASGKLSSGPILLDAGAGKCPYKPFFPQANYIAVDIFKKKNSKLDLIATLDTLPFQSNSVDAILCTQVLEHVKQPQKVLLEFLRVLKAGGSLFLTVPQGWGLHEKPYDYFRFTSYALDFLLKDAGFEIVFIKPRGGYFWYLGDRLRKLPSFVKGRVLRKAISPIFQVLLPLICFYLDRLDEKKDWTLGYSCFCRKTSESRNLSSNSQVS